MWWIYQDSLDNIVVVLHNDDHGNIIVKDDSDDIVARIYDVDS